MSVTYELHHCIFQSDLIWFSLVCPKIILTTYPSYFLCELLKNATNLWKLSIARLSMCLCVCMRGSECSC